MAIALDPKQIVLNDELLLSQVVSQETIIRLLVEKGIFAKEEFMKMVEAVNLEIKKMVQGNCYLERVGTAFFRLSNFAGDYRAGSDSLLLYAFSRAKILVKLSRNPSTDSKTSVL